MDHITNNMNTNESNVEMKETLPYRVNEYGNEQNDLNNFLQNVVAHQFIRRNDEHFSNNEPSQNLEIIEEVEEDDDDEVSSDEEEEEQVSNAEEIPVKEIKEEEQKQLFEKVGCSYVYKKGKKEGNTCLSKIFKNEKCKKHQPPQKEEIQNE